MEDLIKNIQYLAKALEGGAGAYDAAPSSLTQGAAIQKEDVNPVIQNVTAQDKHMFLQKTLEKTPCKSLTAQFLRQLSYGVMGGSAQPEGHVGQEETGEYIRAVVPMCFYSHVRRVTIASTLVDTVDGRKSDEREAESAAKKVAMDLEWDSFRGLADFSNSGVFDGNPLVIPALANMHGVDLQTRQSDGQRNAQDAMFAEFGSSESIVVAIGGVLTQAQVEDMHTRSELNFGEGDDFLIDPRSLAAYNKVAIGKERIILAGSPQESTGSDLRQQFVSGGSVKFRSSHFLRGKVRPAPVRQLSPSAPVSIAPVSTTTAGVVTPFLVGQVYNYYATACNEAGESGACPLAAVTVLVAGDEMVCTITAGAGTTRYYNVYRTLANGAATATACKFIGRVMNAGAATQVFNDRGNKIPGFSTCYLIQPDTMEMKELSGFTRLKLALHDLTTPEAFYQFTTLTSLQPRKNVIGENCLGA